MNAIDYMISDRMKFFFDFKKKKKATVTLQTIIDSIHENGLPQIRGLFIADKSKNNITDVKDYDKAIGACALGQAMVNLGLPHERLFAYLQDFDYRVLHRYSHPTWNMIINLNDGYRMSFVEIASSLEKLFPESIRNEPLYANIDYNEKI